MYIRYVMNANLPHRFAGHFHVIMCWRDIVKIWFISKTLQRETLEILNLIRQLIETNTIPATLVDNETLQSILLTQILLETLNNVSVPRKPQGKNFAYRSNARETIMWNLSAENVLKIKGLEEETGVNLDHYHKLSILNC